MCSEPFNILLNNVTLNFYSPILLCNLLEKILGILVCTVQCIHTARRYHTYKTISSFYLQYLFINAIRIPWKSLLGFSFGI